MAHIARIPTTMTAEEFVNTDQSVFGDAWRYELIDDQIVAQSAPSDEHGLMVTNLGAALKSRLKNHLNGCRARTGAALTTTGKHNRNARIPDILVRCRDLPRVTFEIISPSELQHIKKRDRKREDVKQVDGIVQIIEVYQHTFAAHIHNKTGTGIWELVPINGRDAVIEMPHLGIAIPLIDLYEDAMPPDEVETG